MRHALVAALLAAPLSGCAAFHALPPFEAPPPASLPIFVVVAPHSSRPARGSWIGEWQLAGWFAAELADAGFSPRLVRSADQVPPDAPLIENVKWPPSDECSPAPLVASVVTLGLFPGKGCELHGRVFDLRRTPDAAARHVEATFRTEFVSGWWAIPFWVSSSEYYADTPPGQSERGRLVLRGAVLDALR